ncbi:MAG: hypothetical protein ACOZIN_16905 [Myxococcota bacterium]
MNEKKSCKAPVTDATVAEIETRVEAAIVAADPVVEVLDAEGRRTQAKPRPGWHLLAPLIAGLAVEKGLNMSISVEDMMKSFEGADKLRGVTRSAFALAQGLSDTVFLSESRGWQALTGYYSALLVMARFDLDLKAKLQPAIDFFAVGPRRGNEEEAEVETPALKSVG